MNAVGIDISKGKSMVAVARPFGEFQNPLKFTIPPMELLILLNILMFLTAIPVSLWNIRADITSQWLASFQRPASL